MSSLNAGCLRDLIFKEIPENKTKCLPRYFECPQPPVAAGHRGALSTGKLSGITTSADAGDQGTTKGQRVPQDGAKNPVSKISSSKFSRKGSTSQDSPPEDFCTSPREVQRWEHIQQRPRGVLPSAAASLIPLLQSPLLHCHLVVCVMSCSFRVVLLLPPGFYALFTLESF